MTYKSCPGALRTNTTATDYLTLWLFPVASVSPLGYKTALTDYPLISLDPQRPVL